MEWIGSICRYLREHKNIFLAERYLEIDRARSLGMTLEEDDYDLRHRSSECLLSSL